MSYINLINLIPELDKQRMINYIDRYAVKKQYFIGLDKWLQNWSHANQTLYKLLGEKLIYRIPCNYEKDPYEFSSELDELFLTSLFYDLYLKFINKNFKDTAQQRSLNNLISFRAFQEDKIIESFKIKVPEKKTTLQISDGMKPIKALQKVINYFDFLCTEKERKDLLNSFEDFRIEHSKIFNNKKIKGDLCISIHPLDFMTMSDNNMRWTSCMSWKDGCFNTGTVEMMNSNNVVCCYITSDSPYYFNKDEKKEEYRWNNKKIRLLGYVTKDIIMNGKSYPYLDKTLNMNVLNILKDLANKNLNWDYTFGPELYTDMDHIFSARSMNVIREHMREGTLKKKNILFDTKAMYNDILNNDSSKEIFFCYRNKVKKTKIISLSGKAPCLCCNNQIPTSNHWDFFNLNYLDYNNRYINTEGFICKNCLKDFSCKYCSNVSKTKTYKISIKKNFLDKANISSSTYICKSCFENEIKECPECHKPMHFLETPEIALVTKVNREDLDSSFTILQKLNHITCFRKSTEETVFIKLQCLHMCRDCFSKIDKSKLLYRKYYDTTYFCFENEEDVDIEKYLYDNLKSYNINDFDFNQEIKAGI